MAYLIDLLFFLIVKINLYELLMKLSQYYFLTLESKVHYLYIMDITYSFSIA